MKNIIFLGSVIVSILILFIIRYSLSIIDDGTFRVVIIILFVLALVARSIFKITFFK